MPTGADATNDAQEPPGHSVPVPPLAGIRHTWVELPTGVRMHVAEAGPRHGPALVAIHGWPQHWWAWRGLIGPLAADGWRVICPDLRGMGWSGWPPDGEFGKQRLADDVLALLDALELDQVELIGHDWGGWVAFLLARRQPHRVTRVLACSIVAPWSRPARPGRRDLALAYQPLLATPVIGPALVRETPLVELLMRRATAPSYRWDEAVLGTYVGLLRAPRAAEATSRLYRSFLRRELVPYVRGAATSDPLPMPVLQLVGRQDVVRVRSDPSDRSRADGDWTVELVPDCGHFMLDERPEHVLARARAFLAGH